jgi:hypothetical protein
MKKSFGRSISLGAVCALTGSLLISPDLYARSSAGIAVSDMINSGAAVQTLGDLVAAAVVKNLTVTYPEKQTGREYSSAPAVSVLKLSAGKALTWQALAELTNKPDLPVAPIEEEQPVAAPVLTADAPASGVVAEKSPETPSVATVTIPAAGPLITVTQSGTTYAIAPERILFSSVGETAQVQIAGSLPADLALFVRDNAIAEFSKSGLSITARNVGATELYIVAGGKMNIIPLTVRNDGRPFDLKVPGSLLSLDGIVQGSSSSALFPGIEHAQQVNAQAQNPDGHPALATDGSETDVGTDVASMFYNERAKAQYQTVKVKVVDDRTPIDQEPGRAFPAAGVDIKVVGTKYTARTDASGVAQIPEAPRNARLMVTVSDENGVYRPSVAEIQATGTTQTVRLMRTFSFDGFADIVQSSQHAALGSLCVRLVDDESEAPIAGYRVTLDSSTEGPYYFNAYGFIDRSFAATGADGRACAFNVDPGPVSISVFEGETLVATVTRPVFPGYHLEDVVRFGRESRFRVKLASLAPAAVQLNADVATANKYLPVEYADVMHFGSADPMTYVDFGTLESRDPVPVFGGRLSLAVQTADFEPSIYSIPAGGREIPVLPLAPRGFVEDLAVFAQVTYEPSLGSVLVEYNHHESTAGDSVTLKLVDHNNNSRGEGWYFSDRPLTKAMFFNVPAGVYQLQAETTDGYWLTSQIVYVYDENMTYVRLGGPIRSGQNR